MSAEKGMMIAFFVPMSVAILVSFIIIIKYRKLHFWFAKKHGLYPLPDLPEKNT